MPAQSYCFPLGLYLGCAHHLMCTFSSLPSRQLAYLLASLKSLSSGLPSSKNSFVTPTHTPGRMRCHSSKLISVGPLITYYNLPNKYLLNVCLLWAGL